MKATLTIEVPDDFEKGECTRPINMPSGKFNEVICPLYWHCQYHRAPTNCPLEIEEDTEVRVMNVCGDNRFEIIEKARKSLIESTNIEQSADEMEVLDSFLFRCWQMGWLDKYDTTKKYVSEKSVEIATFGRDSSGMRIKT